MVALTEFGWCLVGLGWNSRDTVLPLICNTRWQTMSRMPGGILWTAGNIISRFQSSINPMSYWPQPETGLSQNLRHQTGLRDVKEAASIFEAENHFNPCHYLRNL